MDLELSRDQLDLRDNMRQVLQGLCPPATVRSIYEGTDDAEALWAQFTELFWPGLSVPEEAGGLGLGFVEVGLLAEELGRAVAPGPLLATVSQLTPALIEAGENDALAEVAVGDRTGSLAIAEDGRWSPSQISTVARSIDSGWEVSGSKTDVLAGAEVTCFVVLAQGDGTAGSGLFLVEAENSSVKPRESIDPTLALADVDFLGAPAVPLLEPSADSDVIDRVLQQAVVGVAMHTVGACRRIFEVTLEYAKIREQYGRVIGSFQALKHRFSDLFLAVERANALTYYAALAIAEHDPSRARTAHAAKIVAGDCQRLVVKDGLQLHGGIGYTWENDLHFLLKRAIAGEVLCGTSRQHRHELAVLLGLVEEMVA